MWPTITVLIYASGFNFKEKSDVKSVDFISMLGYENRTKGKQNVNEKYNFLGAESKIIFQKR